MSEAIGKPVAGGDDGLAPSAATSSFDLTIRAAAALVMGGLALLSAWIGGFWFMTFWFVAAAAALWEWQRLIGGERFVFRLAIGVLTQLAVAPLALHGDAAWTLVALLIGAAACGAAGGPQPSQRGWAGVGVLYTGAILAAPTLLRASPAYGLAAILWLFAVVWCTDTFAYFGGRLIGGPKLWRRISPGKTWAGALVGALAGAGAGAVVAWFASPAGARFAPMMELGLAASVIGQLGDLAESALKRHFEVKDSSRLIPGHGGVLDRLDAFVVAASFAALVGWAHSAGGFPAAGLFQW
ncbi:MAG: phosphatidate cytidylyltransferase [Bradyrhizobium sp.]|nr:MAG: phosphatidate cytidylyltransferase [Bradyrhizobium sp.]